VGAWLAGHSGGDCDADEREEHREFGEPGERDRLVVLVDERHAGGVGDGGDGERGE